MSHNIYCTCTRTPYNYTVYIILWYIKKTHFNPSYNYNTPPFSSPIIPHHPPRRHSVRCPALSRPPPGYWPPTPRPAARPSAGPHGRPPRPPKGGPAPATPRPGRPGPPRNAGSCWGAWPPATELGENDGFEAGFAGELNFRVMVVENQTGFELKFPCDWLWVLGCHQLQCIGCVGKTWKHLKHFETMFVHHQKSEFSVRVFLKSFSTKPSDLWDPMYFNPSWISPFDRTSPNTLACGEASVRSCHNSPKTIRLSLSLPPSLPPSLSLDIAVFWPKHKTVFAPRLQCLPSLWPSMAYGLGIPSRCLKCTKRPYENPPFNGSKLWIPNEKSQ